MFDPYSSVSFVPVLECHTKPSLVCRTNTTWLAVNVVFLYEEGGHKMDVSKESEDRNNLKAGWKGKNGRDVDCMHTSPSLTKTTYSNNPIVSITTRLTDSQRGLGSVC